MSDDTPGAVIVSDPITYEWQGEKRTIPEGTFDASLFKLGPSESEQRIHHWIFDRRGDVGGVYEIGPDTVSKWEQQGRIRFLP